VLAHSRGGRFKRPGRTPLGTSFELVRGDRAIGRAPPPVYVDRERICRAYYAAEKRR
jgi:hypothetical protein